MFSKFDREDIQASFNIVCTLLGIGSLGMAYCFAQAGFLYGTIALVIMCSFNIYATVLLSQCFLHAPNSIETFSDIGFYIYGKLGLYSVQFTQLATCLLVPIVFLILGGQLLLPAIFADAIDINPSWWIIIMALALWPITLIKTLKEAYIVAIIGAATAFFSDFVAVSTSAITVTWEKYTTTEVQIMNIFPVFGTMALSYGAALIVPTIQREHSRPHRMPSVIIVSVVFITTIYMAIAVVGYSQYGCSAPPNLLFSMEKGIWKRLAYLLMQIHITIAFAVVINPALFYIERNVFKLSKSHDEEERLSQLPSLKAGVLPSTGIAKTLAINSPDAAATPSVQASQMIATPVKEIDSEAQIEVSLGRHRVSVGGRSALGSIATCPESELEEAYTTSQRVKSYVIRSTIVAVQTFLAILGQGSFSDIADFIGATTISLCCIIIPCVFYMKMFGSRMSTWHRCVCSLVILISTCLAIYTAYIKIVNVVKASSNFRIFEAAKKTEDTEDDYPFCPSNYKQTMIDRGIFQNTTKSL